MFPYQAVYRDRFQATAVHLRLESRPALPFFSPTRAASIWTTHRYNKQNIWVAVFSPPIEQITRYPEET